MKARFLRPAQSELKEAMAYYEAHRPGLGVQFRDEIYAALQRIIQHPRAWASISERTRRCRTNRFPYNVIYAEHRNEIIVVAVAHMHREPAYWRKRL